MFNYKVELAKQLDTILPAYYELFVDSQGDFPCITYLELANSADAEGDTLRYSSISFRIKIWGGDYTEIVEYVEPLDNLMFSLGFSRRGYNELIESGMCQLIFTYTAMALENNN
jgi:hypothetical protein